MARRTVHNLTESGYDNATPKWALGRQDDDLGPDPRRRAGQGGGAISGDVYGMYFTKAAYDRAKPVEGGIRARQGARGEGQGQDDEG